MKKRILSLVMALVLAIGLLPMSVLAADTSSSGWTISVEKYDAEGNGTYLLEPTVVDYYYKNWVPGILNYYWGNDYSKVEYDSHRNEYYITKVKDDSQEDDGWLDNGDLGENSKWKIVWNGTVLADKPSGCYASRGAVIRYIFSVNGDAAESGVNKDALLQALADLTDAQKETLGNLYTTARTTALNPEATEADVTNAFTALKAALVTPATGITLSSESVNLIEGNSATVTATLTPTNTTDSVSWSVDNTDVATVDENGKVTAVSEGTATLTARANDTVSATAAITVTKETRYVYFAYADGTTQEMAEDGSFTLSSLDQGYFRVGGTDATAWWENEEVIDAGQGSVAYHWYVNRETGAWQPSGQQPTKPIVVTAGDFTKSFTINYKATSGITQLKTYVNGTEVTDDPPYKVTGCVSGVAVTTKGQKADGSWVDIPVQALNYDTSDNVYYNFRFIGNCLEINRAGEATMTVSLKGEDVSTTFGVVCNPVQAKAMKVVVPETPVEISDWDAHGFYVGLRPDTGYSIEFTPENATNRDVTWTALDPEVAEHFTTHSAGIVPKKAGTARFIVTNTPDSELTQEVEVTFTYKNPLTRASVGNLEMAPGTEQALNISVTPEYATEQRFDWTYSRNGIVEVTDEIKTSEDGQSHWTTHSIKALHSGTVTVTGTPWDTTGGCDPVVFTVTVTGDSFLTTRNVTVKAGDTVTYTDETGDYTGSADLRGLDTSVAEVELMKALTSTEITITGVGAGTTSFIAGQTEYIIRVPGPSDSLTAEWPSFRGNDQNNGVTNAKTPRTAGEAELKWAANDGAAKDAWEYSLPTSYIMVDGMIIAASGDKLSQIDPATGKLVQSVTMAGSRGYAYMSPAYGGGMIFVSLEGGKVQAFDAQTLESKWVYTDEKGGQPLSAIVYDDGYLYTGFGNDWTAAPSTERNWVCIPAEDKDPTSTNEAQKAAWTYSHAGGFYWSGAYAAGDYLVVGGDKTDVNKNLYVFDKISGDLTDSIAVDGNIRCTISAYGDNAIAFVTQGGSFYTAQISGEGKIALSEPVTIGGQSTSTPVIVNGYAYVGACSSDFSSMYVAQINLADNTVKTISTHAYPQSSLLASTGYGGKTYLYFTCNGTPGGVQVLEVSANGTMSLSDLYVPEESKQNCCLASLMCDPQGTLYYSNDSGYLFALGTWSASSCPVTFQTTPADAAVAVKDSNGSPVSAARDGVYDLAAGTYTYTVTSGDKSKSGTLVITADDAANHTPQTVTVSLSSSQSGGGSSSSGSEGTITVSIRVADPKGETYLEKTSYTLSSGSTVYDLLVETGLSIKSTDSSFGVYIQSIEGLGELDEGQYSGWMYRVNGTYPDVSCSAQTLKSGDYVEWLYTRDLGTDIGGSGGITVPADQTAADKVADLIAAIGTVTDASGDKITAARRAYDKLTAAQKKLVNNYAVLTAAEQAYAQLTGAEGLPFTDVDGHWALDAIRFVYDQGLMTGTKETLFSPNKTLNRAMLATILYRMEGSPAVTGENPYTDVAAGTWYTDAVLWASEQGIVNGYGNGKFGPLNNITREQLAAMLLRYSDCKKYDTAARNDLTSYADADDISAWALEALRWANAQGLVNGRTETTLVPQGDTTRAETATVLMRYLNSVAN